MQSLSNLRALGCIVSAALVACAPALPKRETSTPQGSVDTRELVPLDSERYGHAGNVDYIQPLAYPENMAPVYPPDMLARRSPPTVIAVRLIVDSNGAVAEVRPLDTLQTPERNRFFGAVDTTCRQWKFSPLIRLDLDAGPTTVVEEGESTFYSGRPTALPFHRDYVFNFSQRDGKPQVDTVEEKSTK